MSAPACSRSACAPFLLPLELCSRLLLTPHRRRPAAPTRQFVVDTADLVLYALFFVWSELSPPVPLANVTIRRSRAAAAIRAGAGCLLPLAQSAKFISHPAYALVAATAFAPPISSCTRSSSSGRSCRHPFPLPT